MQNHDVALFGTNLTLVPYLPHHVPRYHEWMCDPELLELTCSEPLSLEEEYENQKSWLESTDKLTFILLAPLSLVLGDQNRYLIRKAMADTIGTPTVSPTAASPRLQTGPLVMIGDCNAFVNPNEPQLAEVEVSLAQKEFRGRKLAKEAVLMLMCYLLDHTEVNSFVAKILKQNESSIALFTKGLGFQLLKEVPVFDEIHFVLSAETESERTRLRQALQLFEEATYDRDIQERNVIHCPPLKLVEGDDDEKEEEGTGTVYTVEEGPVSAFVLSSNSKTSPAVESGDDDSIQS